MLISNLLLCLLPFCRTFFSFCFPRCGVWVSSGQGGSRLIPLLNVPRWGAKWVFLLALSRSLLLSCCLSLPPCPPDVADPLRHGQGCCLIPRHFPWASALGYIILQRGTTLHPLPLQQVCQSASSNDFPSSSGVGKHIL